MSNETKGQHYVWGSYLGAWAVNNKIWYSRKDKIENASVKKVAKQNLFYEAKNLNPSEVDYILGLLNAGTPLTKTMNFFNFGVYLSIATSTEKNRKYAMERLHGIVETKALKIMKSLGDGDISVLSKKTKVIDFCNYLGHQYMRTKKMRYSFESLPDTLKQQVESKGISLLKVSEVLAFVYAHNIGAHIMENLTLKLVENKSGIKLITSDQPVYNFSAIDGVLPKEMSLYYPISPTVALWASRLPDNIKIENNIDAEKLNSFMATNSYEFIISSSESDLKVALTYKKAGFQ